MNNSSLKKEDWKELENLYKNQPKLLNKGYSDDLLTEKSMSLHRLEESNLVEKVDTDDGYLFFTTDQGAEKVQKQRDRRKELNTNQILTALTSILALMASLDIITQLSPSKYHNTILYIALASVMSIFIYLIYESSRITFSIKDILKN